MIHMIVLKGSSNSGVILLIDTKKYILRRSNKIYIEPIKRKD